VLPLERVLVVSLSLAIPLFGICKHRHLLILHRLSWQALTAYAKLVLLEIWWHSLNLSVGSRAGSIKTLIMHNLPQVAMHQWSETYRSDAVNFMILMRQWLVVLSEAQIVGSRI